MVKRDKKLNLVKSPTQELAEWLKSQGAVESVKFDEDTGIPYQSFSIDLTKDQK